MNKQSWLLVKWVCLLIPLVLVIMAVGLPSALFGAAVLVAVVLDGLLIHAISRSLNRAAPSGAQYRAVLLYVIVYLGLGAMWVEGFWYPYYFAPYLAAFLLAGAYILRSYLVHRPISKKWLLLIPSAVAVAAVVLGLRYMNPRIVIYSEQMTYTMSDDHQTYLCRSPFPYVEPFLPLQAFHIVRPDVWAFVSQLAEDTYQHHTAFRRRYNMSYNLDYTLQAAGGELVITYFGTGKLRDGTVEQISLTDTYPLLKIEDQTAGAWEPPLLPWEIRLPDRLQDPARVIDPPPWPTDEPADGI